MTNEERTLREAGWILTDELFEPIGCPGLTALRELDEESYVKFRDQVYEQPGMRFYSKYGEEYSSATSWEELGKEIGQYIYSDFWEIDTKLPEGLVHACLALRENLRERVAPLVDDDTCFRLFNTLPVPGEELMVINHAVFGLCDVFGHVMNAETAAKRSDILRPFRDYGFNSTTLTRYKTYIVRSDY